jgi:tripartite-type tricarboxylate transporter receptor subunit TctC
MAEVRTHSRGSPPGVGLKSTAAMHVTRNSIAILGSWLALLAVSASHGLAAEMFEGKTITISAAGTPGGGYDAYARLLARHLGKHLPGTPAVVVRNVPGAGGLTLANRLYNVEPKDGTAIGIFQDSNAFAPLLSSAKFEFDPLKFGWLASLDKFVPIVLAWHTKPFFSFEDVRNKEMSVGGSGIGSSSWVNPTFLNAFAGTKFKVVNGYPGSAEITPAIERGELDGYSAWCWKCLKAQKPDWYAGKKARILLQLDFDGDAELLSMGVPTLSQVLETDTQRQLASIVFGGLPMSRPFAAPPGLPPERLAALRAGVKAAASDEAMLADGQKTGNEVTYISPQQITAAIDKAYATKPELVKQLQDALNK